jgi:hypothetical protein
MTQLFACIGLAVIMSVGVFGQSPETKPAFQIGDVHVSPHSLQP